MALTLKILLIVSAFNIFAQNLTTKEFYSTELKRNWRFNLYLPPGYDTLDRKYPVLYLLHGSGGNEYDWDPGIQLIDSLIRYDSIKPVIAVAPASGTSWWVDGKEKFESAFIKDLIPFIELNYKAYRDRERRFVAGFSMGGYGALRYSLAYPELFSAAILLSPSIYNDLPPQGSSAIESGVFGNPFNQVIWKNKNYPVLLVKLNEKQLDVFLYIASGDDDWNHPEGFEYNIDWQVNLLYSHYHKKCNYPAELRILNGGHDWNIWLKMLKEALLIINRLNNGYNNF